MGRHNRDDDADADILVGGLDDVFYNFVELSPDAFFVIVDGFHAYANARGLQLFGASRVADLQEKPALEFMHPTCRQVATERLERMVYRHQPLEYVEERIVRLDGAVVDIEAAGRPIKFGRGNAALVVVRDITVRRQAEAKLRAAEERFRAAFQNAPTGMAIVDAAGMFLDVNAAMARLVGQDPDALHGDLLWRYINAGHLDEVREDFNRVVDNVQDDVANTFRYRKAAGGDGWVHASVSRLSDSKTYIVHMVDITQQKTTEYDLERRANLDPLTNLPNRSQVLTRLTAALRSLREEPGQVHLLFVDLDGFKQVNDRYGHAVGDRVLRAAADRMRGALRPTDVIGRIGGDEFLVVIKSLPHEAPADEIAVRLARAVASPVALDHGIVEVGASIGKASTDDPDYPAARLLGSADADMYRRKQTQQQKRVPARPAGVPLRAVN